MILTHAWGFGDRFAHAKNHEPRWLGRIKLGHGPKLLAGYMINSDGQDQTHFEDFEELTLETVYTKLDTHPTTC